ncbi:MAG: hypothetical protein CMP50_01145 [Flavobacteriales bacterium]|nr:hypothetical protein [Flavobacteriales bacterium]
MVNILSDKLVVSELIQNNYNVKSVIAELNFILDEVNHVKIISEYEVLISKLGNSDCFSQISKIIYSDLLGIKKHANK